LTIEVIALEENLPDSKSPLTENGLTTIRPYRVLPDEYSIAILLLWVLGFSRYGLYPHRIFIFAKTFADDQGKIIFTKPKITKR